VLRVRINFLICNAFILFVKSMSSLNMSNIPFLKINSTEIALSQGIQYLKDSGRLGDFLAQIVRQHLLKSELDELKDVQIKNEEIEQTLLNFRIQNQLIEQEEFQGWLTESGLTYEDLRQGIERDLRLDQLRERIAAPKLQDYFQQQKNLLDQVVLSRIIVEDSGQAELLKQQLVSNPAGFGTLAQEHSLTSDRIMNGMMGPVSQSSLPDVLKPMVESAQPGSVVGPVPLEDRYGLFRIEQFLPAKLEGEVETELKNQLFEQWLQEKMQSLDIQLLVK
jgi:hypothetical protein